MALSFRTARTPASVFLALLVITSPVRSHGAPPSEAATTSPATLSATPAGKVFSDLLDAFNSGDAARLEAFKDKHQAEWTVESMVDAHDNIGDLTLLQVEKSEPLALAVLVREMDSDRVHRVNIAIEAATPPKLLDMQFQPATAPAHLQVARLPLGDALKASEARARELARNDKFSGAWLIARGDEILSQGALGNADRAGGTPNTLDTQFRLGSMNKMFTAVAILQLVHAGKLSLDDTVGKYLRDYPNKDVAAKVTVRHLLTHQGGTGDIFGSEFDANRLSLREHTDYLRVYGSRGLGHEPGAEFRYSNYGYVLLGALIEKVSGRSYYDYVEQHIFQPASMKSTASLPESTDVPRRAVGYTRVKGEWAPNTDTLPYRGMAAGGGYSTVGDLFRFARALETGKLLPKELLAQATSKHASGGPGFNYGFGFGVFGTDATTGYGHGGGAPGMNGDLRVYPKLGYTVIALSNLDPPAASRIVEFFALRMPVR